MFLRIIHLTRYEYSQRVTFAPHAVYLRPRETPRQLLHRFELTLSPMTSSRVATTDAEGNSLEWIYFAGETESNVLEFRSESIVETRDINPFDFYLRPSATVFPFQYNDPERYVLTPCLTPPVGSDQDELRSWLAAHLPKPPEETVPYLTALNLAVHDALAYRVRFEPGIQTPAETLSLGSGSCRDYAVLFIALCRLQGLAARFVSGYLFEPPTSEIPNPVPPEMHAWAEVYLPGAGWRGIDPSRGIFCDDRWVQIAHSAIAESVNPVHGTFFGAGVRATLITKLTLDRS